MNEFLLDVEWSDIRYVFYDQVEKSLIIMYCCEVINPEYVKWLADNPPTVQPPASVEPEIVAERQPTPTSSPTGGDQLTLIP